MHYRLPQLAEQTRYELHDPAADGQEDAAALKTLFASAPPVAFLAAPDDRLAFKRKLGADRILYYGDDLQAPLPLGVQTARGAVNRRYSQVFDGGSSWHGLSRRNWRRGTDRSRLCVHRQSDRRRPVCRSGRRRLVDRHRAVGVRSAPLAEFCLPRASRDFGGKSKQITYFGDGFLIMSALTDAMGLKAELTDFDMRLLRPTRPGRP
jgi:hypothetical protein